MIKNRSASNRDILLGMHNNRMTEFSDSFQYHERSKSSKLNRLSSEHLDMDGSFLPKKSFKMIKEEDAPSSY